MLSDTRLSAYYTHRRLDSAIEVMSLDEASSVFLGNPGLGLASHLPKAERTYDGVTLVLSRTFRDGWLAQASYTWSRLYGNYIGLVREHGTIFPSDFAFGPRRRTGQVFCLMIARTPSSSSAPGCSTSPVKCPPALACPISAARALPSTTWARTRLTGRTGSSSCRAAHPGSVPHGSTTSTPTWG
ncbi:hypothetical protein ACN28S_07430 [Cystobacter fuscus]